MNSVRPLVAIARNNGVRQFSRSTRLAAGQRSKAKANPAGRKPAVARPSRGPSSASANPKPSTSQVPPSTSSPSSPEGQNAQISNALQQSASDNSNNLLAPVHIPEDENAILRSGHPATGILANSSIVVQRQLEMMNVMLGFEQANRYIVMDAHGNHIGYMAEREHGVGNAVARQMFRTHRSFTTHVFDRNEREVLRFHRPFSYISSRIKVYDAANPNDSAYSASTALSNTSAGSISNQTSASISNLEISDMRVIGEAQQQWAPLRRKYNLFLSHSPSISKTAHNDQLYVPGESQPSSSMALESTEGNSATTDFAQFAYVNEPFLSWDFSLLSEEGNLIASVNRNFMGFAREIFTDTGVYALRMDAAGLTQEPEHLISRTGRNQMDERLGMTLDQRAVMLATAVSIDFDYFSRHSNSSGVGFFPFFWGGGGEAAGAEAGAAGAAGAAAGEVGAAEGGAAGTSLSETEAAARGAQEAARGYGSGEGPIAGAGSLAAYEAMQRSREQGATSGQDQYPSPQEQQQQPTDQQGNDDDFWGGQGGGGGGGGGGASGGDGGGGGFSLEDFFS